MMNKKSNDNEGTPIKYNSLEEFIHGEGAFSIIPDEENKLHHYFVFLSLYERDNNNNISATRFKDLDPEIVRNMIGMDKKELSSYHKVKIYNALCDIEDGSKTAEEVLLDILNMI